MLPGLVRVFVQDQEIGRRVTVERVAVPGPAAVRVQAGKACSPQSNWAGAKSPLPLAA